MLHVWSRAKRHPHLPVCWLVLLALAGCRLTGNRTAWHPPEPAAPNADAVFPWFLAGVEDEYLAARSLEEDGRPECVDHYCRVAARVWPMLEQELDTKGKTSPRATELYHASVARMLITGQQFGRWQAGTGMLVQDRSGTHCIPCEFHDFSWQPHNFQHLEPVGEYATPGLTRAFRSSGLGVPVVVARSGSGHTSFVQADTPFAATVLLKTGGEGCRLAFHNPLQAGTVCVRGRSVAMSRDSSVPFAFAAQGEDREWLDNFIRPGNTGSRDGLFMIEPYQPGKIPVVFVHGLLSEPATWADLVNELRNRPGLNDRFQWWGFEYATGEPFLTSAEVLRRQLAEVQAKLGEDPALYRTVLVGHSMGGLVAKLQVTHSGEQLWRAAARKPLDAVVTSEETREHLRRNFYFEPSPLVSRVVFIGTPHLGSAWARRPVGLLGSALVEVDPETEALHAQLVRDNPGLFREEITKRFPTSVDLLRPESKLLAATTSLPYSPRVCLHSIVGEEPSAWGIEPSDGVVPVSSARLVGVSSELTVETRHQGLHRNPQTVEEIACILRDHAQYVGL